MSETEFRARLAQLARTSPCAQAYLRLLKGGADVNDIARSMAITAAEEAERLQALIVQRAMAEPPRPITVAATEGSVADWSIKCPYCTQSFDRSTQAARHVAEDHRDHPDVMFRAGRYPTK